MPPPLSDEALIANFTKKEREFFDWYEANKEVYEGGCDNLDIWIRMAKQQWPDDEEAKKFRKWVGKWTCRAIDRLFYVMPSTELVDLICATNVMSSDSVQTLLGTMEMRTMPMVLLGESDFDGLNGYALIPGAAYLWPNHEVTSEAGLLERIVLGINTSIAIEFRETVDKSSNPSATTQSPRKRRQERSSGEDSVRSTNSGDIDAPDGFLFLQIGALYAFVGQDDIDDSWASVRSEGINAIIPGPWRPTGFGVVIRINARGQQGGVYIIYNFYQEDKDSPYSTRHHVPISDSHGNPLSHIGRLQEGGQHFTIARIANSLRDLRDGNRFAVAVQERKECQIVRAKMSGAGQGHFVLRQFVLADS